MWPKLYVLLHVNRTQYELQSLSCSDYHSGLCVLQGVVFSSVLHDIQRHCNKCYAT
jgi:hypothetical protein